MSSEMIKIILEYSDKVKNDLDWSSNTELKRDTNDHSKNNKLFTKNFNTKHK